MYSILMCCAAPLYCPPFELCMDGSCCVIVKFYVQFNAFIPKFVRFGIYLHILPFIYFNLCVYVRNLGSRVEKYRDGKRTQVASSSPEKTREST